MGVMDHLTREQTIDVLAQAKASRERDWVMFLVTFWHGLRASETVGLTPENFDHGCIDVQRKKGSDRTVQQMIEDGHELLDERPAIEKWLAAHKAAHNGDGNSRRLFPISRIQFYRLYRRYARAAGLPRRLQHPHVLKHSIAMQSIHVAGIENVRRHLGHKTIASTGEYLKVTDEAATRAVAEAASRKTVQKGLFETIGNKT
jgi:integrase